MEINKNNYQAFILDYYEGNLSEKQAAKLMSFLEKHPELKKEFDEFEIIKLEDNNETPTFEGKGFLKKPEPEIELPITNENFELFCIAEIENLLNKEQVAELDRFVSENPSFDKIRKKYLQAHATPDKSITFENKEYLKKQPALKVESLHINEDNYEEYFLAYIEDELTFRQQKDVEAYIKNDPERAKELAQWEKTILKPDNNIKLPGKASLKRHKFGAGKQLWYRVSAAAVVLIIASFFFINDMVFDQKPEYIAHTERGPHIIKPQIERIEPSESELTLASHQPEATEETTGRGEMLITQPQREYYVEDIQPRPLNVQRMEFIPASQVAHNKVSRDFLALDQRTIYKEESTKITEPLYVEEGGGFRNVVFAEIQKRTRTDLDAISNENFSFWDLAGNGLAAISQITGSQLNVDKERDEEGKVTYLAVGNTFAISRD